MYIEAEKDYCWLHTATKSYLSNYGIGMLEQKMDPSLFIRIHRSYIINIEQIKELHKEGSTAHVIMWNEKSLNVSRSYMDDLKKLLY
jgi:two-component system LytT family response regulator